MVSPIGVVVIAAGWDDARIVTALLGAAGTIGLPFVLESFVRQAGLRYDVNKLPESNGRWTTTNMLWPEEEGSVLAARNAENRRVVESVLGVTLPSAPPADEAEAAVVEAKLDEAAAELRSGTRDRAKFELLAEENAEYGMWRNLLGVRMYGFVIALVAMIGAAVLVGISLADAFTSSTAEIVVGWLV